MFSSCFIHGIGVQIKRGGVVQDRLEHANMNEPKIDTTGRCAGRARTMQVLHADQSCGDARLHRHPGEALPGRQTDAFDVEPEAGRQVCGDCMDFGGSKNFG